MRHNAPPELDAEESVGVAIDKLERWLQTYAREVYDRLTRMQRLNLHPKHEALAEQYRDMLEHLVRGHAALLQFEWALEESVGMCIGNEPMLPNANVR